jgi:hypothetical protein
MDVASGINSKSPQRFQEKASPGEGGVGSVADLCHLTKSLKPSHQPAA